MISYNILQKRLIFQKYKKCSSGKYAMLLYVAGPYVGFLQGLTPFLTLRWTEKRIRPNFYKLIENAALNKKGVNVINISKLLTFYLVLWDDFVLVKWFWFREFKIIYSHRTPNKSRKRPLYKYIENDFFLLNLLVNIRNLWTDICTTLKAIHKFFRQPWF